MNYEQGRQRIKALIDDAQAPYFLDRLTEIARLYGWAGDYTEIADFVADLHRLAGKEPPDSLRAAVEYDEDIEARPK